MLEHHEHDLATSELKLMRYDRMYMDIAKRIGEMSHAERTKVGAVLVKDTNILSFGFNGTPTGFDNDCEDFFYGNMVTKPEVLHAESNAIAKVAMSTQSSEGSTLYVTLSPCVECAKMIIQAGLSRVVYKEKYRDDSGMELLARARLEVEQLYE